ncbi:MAG: hypothetical protein M3O30_02085 [Planctomycetota bacterium]|nr:hypothetical protein [Planctomycetota bacterium]
MYLSAQPNLSATAASPTEIDLTYSTDSAKTVQLQEQSSGDKYKAIPNFLADLSPGIHTFEFTGLKPATKYDFRLTARKERSRPGSALTSATTLPVSDATQAGSSGVVQPAASTITVLPTDALSSSGVALTILASTAFDGTIARFKDSDLSADPSLFTASVNWGDYSQSSGNILSDGAGGFLVNASKTYNSADLTPYAITITIGNTDGSQAIIASTITVDLPQFTYSAPSSDPALPSDFNTFTPPVGTFDAVAGAPVIAASNPTAGPNDSITVTGSQLTAQTGAGAYSDTQFIVYGQTTAANGDLTSNQSQDNSVNGSIVTISPTEPSNSMYLMWPQNNIGVGAPVAINQTQAWWLGNSAQATTGQTISLYGENLSSGATTERSWVYIQAATGAGEWATVTAVNPYKVDFVVPSDLPTGVYQVWANNGMGGKFGWATPLTLNVRAAAGWDLNLGVNVKSFGAVGDGIHDDAPAINAALIALSPHNNDASGATLYFPAGTYLVGNDEHFDLPKNIRLLGDSPQSTTIVFPFAPVNHGKGPYLISAGDYVGSNIEFNSISLQSTFVPTRNSDSNWQRYGTLVREQSGSNFTFDNVSLIANSLQPLDWQGSNGLTLERSTVVGLGITLFNAQNAVVDGNSFFQRYEDAAALIIWDARNIRITGNNVRDFDDSATDGSGTGFGRFIEYGLNWGSIYHQYVANNTTMLGARSTGTFNAGEQINIEGAQEGAYGSPSDVTSNTIILPLSSFDPNHLAGFNPLYGFQPGEDITVTAGAGIGQRRAIESVSFYPGNGDPKDAIAARLTLDRPWNVIPDSTSTVDVSSTAFDSVFYYNNLQDVTGPAGAALGSSSGIQIYSGGYGLVVDSNTTSNLRVGVFLTSAGTNNPNYFNEVINNSINHSLFEGVLMGIGSGSPDPNFIGTVIRDNSIDTSVTAGISLTWVNVGSVSLSIIEHNTISNTPIGLMVYTDPDVLVYENSFDSGSVLNAVAVEFENQLPAILLGRNFYISDITPLVG